MWGLLLHFALNGEGSNWSTHLLIGKFCSKIVDVFPQKHKFIADYSWFFNFLNDTMKYMAQTTELTNPLVDGFTWILESFY